MPSNTSGLGGLPEWPVSPTLTDADEKEKWEKTERVNATMIRPVYSHRPVSRSSKVKPGQRRKRSSMQRW